MALDVMAWFRGIVTQALRDKDDELARLRAAMAEATAGALKRADAAEQDLRVALVRIGELQADIARYQLIAGEIGPPSRIKRLTAPKKETE